MKRSATEKRQVTCKPVLAYQPALMVRAIYLLYVLLFSILLKQNCTAEIIAPFKEHPEIQTSDKIVNFTLVYIAQWSVYFANQHETIAEHGSLEKWRKNPLKPHFDKDNFDYNLFQHTWVGQYYFLFYRSRGHSKRTSLMFSWLSSLAFEFTIETVTEQPSFQDAFQTPVFGTVLGCGTEKLSRYFLSFDTTAGDILAVIFNPFLILPPTSRLRIAYVPAYKTAIIRASWEF